MSTEQDHSVSVSVPAPAPKAAVQLRSQLGANRRVERWVPAFEQDWTRALEDAAPAGLWA
ncbi:hypothetical protein [Streptomyces sp. B21-083]|uniref:hypothetical protein n=1 Tax=Streptomyces sp. B21-083 TaxID=3039410 RepID=UPI002FF08909